MLPTLHQSVFSSFPQLIDDVDLPLGRKRAPGDRPKRGGMVAEVGVQRVGGGSIDAAAQLD